MKKKFLAGMLVSATVLGMFVAGGTALATEKDTVDTEVGIGFTDHIPGTKPGPLKIQWAPGKFNFGDANEVKTSDETYTEKSGLNKYVVVTDTRNNPTDKWELSAKLGNLTSGANQLTGAELLFDATEKGFTGTQGPEAGGSVITADPSNNATVSSASVTLSQGATATSVFGDAGPGTYQGFSAMEMSNIKLKVKGNSAIAGEKYTGKLTWSLDDTL